MVKLVRSVQLVIWSVDQGLWRNWPKGELVRHVHNYFKIIHEANGLLVGIAKATHVQEGLQTDAHFDGLHNTTVVVVGCLLSHILRPLMSVLLVRPLPSSGTTWRWRTKGF